MAGIPPRAETPPPPGKRWCTCTAYCRRPGRPRHGISDRAWYDHAKFRKADEEAAIASTQAAVPPAPVHKRARADTESSAAQTQRLFQPEDRLSVEPSYNPHVELSDSSQSSAPTPFASSGDTRRPVSVEPDPLLPDQSGSVRATGSAPDSQATAAAVDQPDVGSISLREYEERVQRAPINDEVNDELQPSSIAEIRHVEEFIHALEHADIHNGDLSEHAVQRLLQPSRERVTLSEDEDRSLLLSLRLYLAHLNSPETAYSDSIRACRHAHPDDELLSLHQLKIWMEDTTGVLPIVHDMCPNSCMAYTGPQAGARSCVVCSEPRYDPRTGKPRQRFSTMPLGPSIQAMHRDPDMSRRFEYGAQRLAALEAETARNGGRVLLFDDVLCGSDILQAWREKRIKPTDILLMVSYDGCQIYRDKQSDCWIYIWIFLSISPDFRYKLRAVFPGGFVPGPNKPKDFESFIFPGLHHLAAINSLPSGGLPVWQSHSNRVVYQRLVILLAGADGPAMTSWNGLVGHSGRLGCRFLCMMKGRRKSDQGAGHHYPCMLRPDNYSVEGCDHPDYSATDLPSSYSTNYSANLAMLKRCKTNAEYLRTRASTGISRPSILSGLGDCVPLGVPRMCGGDIMHLVLNLGELLIPLWRGTFECSDTDRKESWFWAKLTDATWEQHGRDVAAATPYLPGSFGRAPRNPAEKINSGYKQWEYLLYLFGLCPGLLYKVLPENIWGSFCKLVRGVRMAYQYRSGCDSVDLVEKVLLEFMHEFELHYYQRRPDRVHFVRQSVHTLCHIAPEIRRIGPGICSSQFPIERTIGNLTQELRLHSAPYANLSQRGLLRCTVNALCAMLPELDISSATVQQQTVSVDVGGGYQLLPRVERSQYSLSAAESTALSSYLLHVLHSQLNPRSVIRWARLRLPNGQIARSTFKEGTMALQNLRVTRNVKFTLENRTAYGEVRFYFRLPVGQQMHNLCMLALYSPPDADLYRSSFGTVHSCTFLGDAAIRVVDVSAITAVVAMVPHSYKLLDAAGLGAQFKDRVFLVERPSLDVMELGEQLEPDEEV